MSAGTYCFSLRNRSNRCIRRLYALNRQSNRPGQYENNALPAKQYSFYSMPVIAQHFLWEAPFKEALQFRSPHLRIVLLGCLTIMVSSPFVDILNTWNQGLHLPESLHSIEQWMIESERQAEVLTQQILNVSTWQGFIMNILVVAILAGVGEELLFRGVLQKIFIDGQEIYMQVSSLPQSFSALYIYNFSVLFPDLS